VILPSGLVILRTPQRDRIPANVVQEEENRSNSDRVGSSANFPYTAACSSAKNSTGMRRT
jgi:hypothetical protein